MGPENHPKEHPPASEALRNLRKKVTDQGTITEMAERVGLRRSELNRVLSGRIIDALEDVEAEVADA